MINKIFNEDCLETLNRNIEYDYIFFSPPDYDELNLEPIKEALFDVYCFTYILEIQFFT